MVDIMDAMYEHAGGWQPFEGHIMNDVGVLKYSGDPPSPPYVVKQFGTETVRIYPHAWVSIQQEDGSYEVAHMD